MYNVLYLLWANSITFIIIALIITFIIAINIIIVS